MSKDMVWPGWCGLHWVGDRREERHDRDITRGEGGERGAGGCQLVWLWLIAGV